MKLILLSLIVLLTGCATFTPKTSQPLEEPVATNQLEEPVATNQLEERWEHHQQAISTITSWNLKGKAAVSSGTKGGTANVIWQQQPHNYHIELYGLLGQGRTELIGQGQEVRLLTTEGPEWRSTDAQSLLGKYTGWYLPVENLYYWVRGIPAPTHITSLELNQQGQLTRLQQAGWTIIYSDYVKVENIWLPQRISLKYPGSKTGPPLTVKWLSKEWVI